MTNPRILAFYEPGHFHAALTLRTRNPRVADEVHLYATPGPERDAFISLVDAFNSRTDAPTAWRVIEHAGRDSTALLDALVTDRTVDAVVLAGKNDGKGACINRITADGWHVLADKPCVTRATALPDLEATITNPGLALDIMTSRFDVVASLRRALTREEALFGGFRRDSEPAIEMRSVHHLMKRVNGEPLRRPPWYYDVAVQGDGVVDIQTHMTDQAQWLVERDRPLSFAEDVAELQAVRWPTEVPLSLYRASTGRAAFAPEIIPHVTDDVLALNCNAVINYTLNGVSVHQHAQWRSEEPEGGGDLHHAVLRGAHVDVVMRQNERTGYRAELHVRNHAHPALSAALPETLQRIQRAFPGVHIQPSDVGFQIVIPDALHTGHEAHFAMVLESFLDHLDAGKWPASLGEQLRLRYTLLATAQATCLDQEAPR